MKVWPPHSMTALVSGEVRHAGARVVSPCNHDRVAGMSVCTQQRPNCGHCVWSPMCHVWTGSELACVDGSELARVFSRLQAWSVQPCVRPIYAVHMPLAIMPSADQVPVNNPHSMLRWHNNPHSMLRWHKWVVLIAGSTAPHYVLFALPTFTSR